MSYVQTALYNHPSKQETCDDPAWSICLASAGEKLLDQYRDTIRLKPYSARTEKTHVSWMRAYILFHDKRQCPKNRHRPRREKTARPDSRRGLAVIAKHPVGNSPSTPETWHLELET
ncbi:MAG: phage integrase N-terminal SAM-like domain-containing protein [Chloroflexota bacterium]